MEQEKRPSTGTSMVLPIFVAACAVIAGLLMLSSGFGARLNLWHFRTGFSMLKFSAYSALGVALLALASGVLAVRKRRLFATLVSLVALIVALIVFSVPYSWQVKARSVPRIHDITTDLNNPPRFVAIAPLRPDRLEYGGAAVAAEQMKAYPEIKTMIVAVPGAQAFNAALSAARDMGWEIVAAVPAEGRIEATDTTFWYGFKDDIVIRVVPAGERSLLDIRSASRVGISDAGTNAARIRAFMSKMGR